ncbi:MAG: hypothetical protein V5A20_13900, partial [Salinibacter sp.]|uniref:hypothetical protein n=1 Tax=Salinibacter sp. TaxID=2065818 RepID=UPI002FC3BB41
GEGEKIQNSAQVKFIITAAVNGFNSASSRLPEGIGAATPGRMRAPPWRRDRCQIAVISGTGPNRSARRRVD